MSRQTTKKTPIRVGDRFTDSRGDVWKVIESKPCGLREMLSESGRLRFRTSYTRDIRRNMQRRVVNVAHDEVGGEGDPA